MVNYRVKVRRTTFLWGSAGVTGDLDRALFLHFRVDEAGDPVRVGVRRKGSGYEMVEVGVLQPGECFTIRLDGLAGVWAQLPEPADSYVECTVLGEG